jgi:solute carrier family 35 protein C2
LIQCTLSRPAARFFAELAHCPHIQVLTLSIYVPDSYTFFNFCFQAEIVMYVAAWFAISVSLTLTNKWFFSFWHGGFDLPVSSTALQMVIKAVLAHVLINCHSSPWREEPYPLNFRKTLILTAPIGLATAADITLSNFSFLFITVTLYTIVKSGSLLWLLFWGVVLRLEECSVKLMGICFTMSIGLALASYGATRVSLLGIVLVLMASCVGGLRWALSQRLMAIDSAFAQSPLLLVAKIAPWSAVCTCVAALVLDGKRLWQIYEFGWVGPETIEQSGLNDTNAWTLFTEVLAFVSIGGLASLLLLMAEVKLLQLTSSLSLGVFGVIKEILQIILAVGVFHDTISLVNVLGLALCIGGTGAYHHMKHQGLSRLREQYEYNLVNLTAAFDDPIEGLSASDAED